jgi:hypothetical protein
MYKLQLDKASEFECKIKVSGASIKKTKVNLVVEGDDYSLKFKGTINEDGKISVPISKLKGILDEGRKGNLFLEVIADDTYFTPYETQYETIVLRKVEMISLDKSKQELIEQELKGAKPKIVISDVNESSDELVLAHTKNILKEIKRNNLNPFLATNNKQVVTTIRKYLSENNINSTLNKSIMANIYNVISRIK